MGNCFSLHGRRRYYIHLPSISTPTTFIFLFYIHSFVGYLTIITPTISTTIVHGFDIKTFFSFSPFNALLLFLLLLFMGLCRRRYIKSRHRRLEATNTHYMMNEGIKTVEVEKLCDSTNKPILCMCILTWNMNGKVS